jgi:hypothetical protein
MYRVQAARTQGRHWRATFPRTEGLWEFPGSYASLSVNLPKARKSRALFILRPGGSLSPSKLSGRQRAGSATRTGRRTPRKSHRPGPSTPVGAGYCQSLQQFCAVFCLNGPAAAHQSPAIRVKLWMSFPSAGDREYHRASFFTVQATPASKICAFDWICEAKLNGPSPSGVPDFLGVRFFGLPVLVTRLDRVLCRPFRRPFKWSSLL